MTVFNDIIHVPTRLRTCSILAEADEIEFGLVRDSVAVSDSVLSKHIKVLEQAGYVTIRKGIVDTRTRTWLALTRAGRQAFTDHVEELRRLTSPAGTRYEPRTAHRLT
ncbi:transcriptional regulator [Rhodococcus sp. H36-A4]|uniref:transcriptional regulator n=1 Tax=Rhodococcus sp. H36-A4 TaxID=3004353 RepID=UPI0022AE5B76|nr:transcriptional regulator [Rhodococcus sp. H36-A4]MCZ4077484.1 transcriptional regulator [Rhodococcus sp. H36-A4]